VFKGATTTYTTQHSPHSCQPSTADRKEHNDMTTVNVMDATGGVFTHTHTHLLGNSQTAKQP
jgi:hypothetical protein